MADVLIIDDNHSMNYMLVNYINRMGHRASARETLAAGLVEAVSTPYDVIFLDVQMPDGNGLEFITKLRHAASSPEVIIMTGYGDANSAETAIKYGAWDYILKTDSPEKIKRLLKRITEYRGRFKGAPQSRQVQRFNGIIGNSAPMKACYDMSWQASVSSGNVLLTGETGTGKELFARIIHENSANSKGNFIVVDCAALPENLVENIMFGHEKGAFTSADSFREGLVSQAHNGTLFLDEVGEMPLSLQKVFLRVLQERRYRPVGGKKEYASNFRLISATNRDLDQMADTGKFRLDLLFRLRTLSITIPPLCKRGEDIVDLARYYIGKISKKQKLKRREISPDFLEALSQYHWPGNVRELINAMETASASAGPEEILFSKHLPDYIRIRIVKKSLPNERKQSTAESLPIPVNPLPAYKTFRKQALEEAEREYFERLSVVTNGDVRSACLIAKLSRSRYYELIKQHGIIPGPPPKAIVR